MSNLLCLALPLPLPLVDCHPPLPLTPAADLTVVDRNARNTMLVVKSGQIYVIVELQKMNVHV